MHQTASVPVGPIPLMVALWNTPDFTATKRTIIASLDQKGGHLVEKDNPTLEYIHYNRQTQAIGIHAGPQFARGYTVSFFDEAWDGEPSTPRYRGWELCLAPGVYPHLELINWANRICAVRFNEPFTRDVGLYQEGVEGEQGLADLIDGNRYREPAHQVPQIPLVVRLIDTDDVGPRHGQQGSCGPYTGGSGVTYYPCELWRCLTLVEDAYDFRIMFGEEYDATTREVIVQKGPDYGSSRTGFEARLYEGPSVDDPDVPAHLDFGPDDDTEPDSGGGSLGVAKGNWQNLYTAPWIFDQKARAMRIVAGDAPYEAP